jgi:NRPS condensation-like uncharacterized protein
MSLSRDEWAKMWESIKYIEQQCQMIRLPRTKATVLKEVQFIKEKIQSVVGQME